jgi:hypothetical protein
VGGAVTKTAYLDSVALANGVYTADVENQAIADAASLTPGTDTASIAAASSESAFVFSAEADFPDSADWPGSSSGDPYKAVISVSAIGADLTLNGGAVAPQSIFIQFTADLASYDQFSGGTWDSTTGTGLKTLTQTGWNPGAGLSTYRAGLVVSVKNAATMKAETITLNLGTTATYMQGPWPIVPALLGAAAAVIAPVVSVPPTQTISNVALLGSPARLIGGVIDRVNGSFAYEPGTVGEITVSMPQGVVADDLLLAWISQSLGGGGIVSIPNGWALVPGSEAGGLDDSDGVWASWFYYKVAVANEPSATWGFFNPSLGARASVVAYRKVSTTSPFQNNAEIGYTAFGTQIDYPSQTVVAATAKVAGVSSSSQDNLPLTSWPSGYSTYYEQFDSTVRNHHWWDGDTPVLGETGTLTVGWEGGQCAAEGYALTLRPASGGVAVAQSVVPALLGSTATAVTPESITGAEPPQPQTVTLGAVLDQTATQPSGVALEQQVGSPELLGAAASLIAPSVGQQVSIALKLGTESTPTQPFLNQGLSPALLDQTALPGTGPEVQQSVSAVLLGTEMVAPAPEAQQAGAPQSVTVAELLGTAVAAVSPTAEQALAVELLGQAAAAVEPAIQQAASPQTVTVTELLGTATSALTPDVAQGIEAVLLGQTAQVVAPTEVLQGQFISAPDLIGSAASVVAPMLDQSAVVVLLDQTATAPAPSIDQSVAASLLTTAAALFDATIGQAAAVPLLGTAADVVAPAVAQGVEAVLLGAAATVTAPAFEQQVQAVLLDQTATAPTPEVIAPQQVEAVLLGAALDTSAPDVQLNYQLVTLTLLGQPADVLAPTLQRKAIFAAGSHTPVSGGWVNPQNAYATDGDNVYSTASPGAGSISGDFGFADVGPGTIPDESIIGAVRLVIEIGATAVGLVEGVQGVLNGTPLGTEVTKVTAEEGQIVFTFPPDSITLADLRNASTLIKARMRASGA